MLLSALVSHQLSVPGLLIQKISPSYLLHNLTKASEFASFEPGTELTSSRGNLQLQATTGLQLITQPEAWELFEISDHSIPESSLEINSPPAKSEETNNGC